jgi:NhaP-type Na+/H+ or K+/H+ antiporter
LAWSGLRGALTITLALALPPEAPSRDLIVAMSFGVVLFTLLVQGLSLPLLLRHLGWYSRAGPLPRAIRPSLSWTFDDGYRL